MYMYVLCIYTHICMYMHIYMDIHIYIHIYTCMYIYVHIHVRELGTFFSTLNIVSKPFCSFLHPKRETTTIV